ncbi:MULTISPECIES: hypothetical protein [unclassified Pseudoalteromonas]|uniref:hypothetical protein n=1 Tax=unclassified Pseudoalteromonas TaxID=194690 RepID=UPI00209746E2|nr:hypothetical protein [Pseudoalteromonas sp. XMcav2-N]MCO7190124.1 hypothetical protein [Pseudoalteromonas sp. XMcav2-N]
MTATSQQSALMRFFLTHLPNSQAGARRATLADLLSYVITPALHPIGHPLMHM